MKFEIYNRCEYIAYLCNKANVFSYIQVAIESKDQFLDPAKNESTDTRLVGRLMVTTDSKNLQKFFSNPNSVFTEALRLSKIFQIMKLYNVILPVKNTVRKNRRFPFG